MNIILGVVLGLQLVLLVNSNSTKTDVGAIYKPKRNVAGQVQNYGENRGDPLVLYQDNTGSSRGLTDLYKPVFDPVPKHVAAQQVLYEFQQTPTNAVSNVHVNQFYQPMPQKEGDSGPAQFVSEAETIANPVQHSALIRHGQNYAQVHYQPAQPQQVPGKYIYLNGKIVYSPPQSYNPQPHNNHQLNPYRPPVNYYNPSLQQKLTPPPVIPVYRRFQAPLRHQLQQITKPIPPPEVKEEPKEEEEEPKEENSPEVEDDEENDETEGYEEDDDDSFFDRYKYDEDHDHEDDDEEDNERGSSRQVPKKHKKKSKPHKKNDNYKYRQSYSTSSKYDSKSNKKNRNKSPKSRTTKQKPHVDRLEGKQSKNIPVVHQQKFLKEKWYVSKSTDEST